MYKPAIVRALLVGVLCSGVGFYAGSVTCHRADLAGAQAALRRASEAVTVGRQDEGLQYAFAALDRDPDLFPAYEVAADAVSTQPREALARHLYRAALIGIGDESSRARIQAKIAALGGER